MTLGKGIPGWAGAIAISCLILLVGAWGGKTTLQIADNSKNIAAAREMNAGIAARLVAVEERLNELKLEVRRLIAEMKQARALFENVGKLHLRLPLQYAPSAAGIPAVPFSPYCSRSRPERLPR